MTDYHYDVNSGHGFGGDFSSFEWTKDAPTEEGWYWIITNGEPYMVNLKKELSSGLYFESLGLFWDMGMKEYKITYWLGPLPIPELPE